MPIYEYVCSSCQKRTEVMRRFSDPPLTECDCGGELRKVLSVPAIIFKGSGFYATDYRSESYKRAAKGESQSHTDKGPAAGKPANEAGKADGKTGAGGKGAHAEKGKKK